MVIAAFVVSIVSVFAAFYAARVAHRVEESGFKAEEQFKTDIVALLSALRSIIVKGTLSATDSTPRSLEKEIETVRSFQAGTSGLALAAWAARQGNAGGSEDPMAGRWRTLSLNLSNIAGITEDDAARGEASTNAQVREWATRVELTLENLTEDSVKAISKYIGDLPGAFAALKESRENDILLRIWFDIYRRNEELYSLEREAGKLKYLRDIGIDDPDVNMWLALAEGGNRDDLQGALDSGARQGASLNEVLARYQEALASYEEDTPEEGQDATQPDR